MAYKQGEILHIKIKELFNIEKGTLQSTKCIEGQYNFITASSEWKTHNEFTHDTEAIIIAVAASGSLGRAHYVNGKFISSDLCFILTPKSEKYPLDLSFYYFIFNSIRDDLVKSTATGTSKLAINKSNFGAYQIPYLDVSKQKEFKNKLANITERKGQLVAINEKQTEIIQSLRQQILQDAITGKLSEKWRKENPNIESAGVLLGKIKAEKEKLVKEGKIKKQKTLPPITEDEIPFELPEGWVWCRLGEIGKTNVGLTYSPSDISYLGTPVIRANNIQEGKLILNDLVYVSLKIGDPKMLKPHDIVICSRSGSSNLVGKAAIINQSGFSFGAFMTYFRTEYHDYIFNFLQSDLYRAQINDKKSTGINQLTQGVLTHLLLPLPPLAEQQYIVDRIKSLFAKLNRIKELNIGNQSNIDLLNQVVLKEMFEMQ